MNVDNLTSLSFEQLGEIQKRIDQAIFEKRSIQVEDAVSDFIDLMASKYPDLDLWDVLNELAFRSHICLEEPAQDRQSVHALEVVKNPPSSDDKQLSVRDLEPLLERIKNIRNWVLKDDNSRLLWLTNGATQKTSKMSGKELAEVLQDVIKKIERLESPDDDLESVKDINVELNKVDEWAEFKLGISLLQGTITVINPVSNRDSQPVPTPRLSQRTPVMASKETTSEQTLNFPLMPRSNVRRYAT